MAHLVNFKKYTDERGNLSVIEKKDTGFEIKRIFYIWGADNQKRGCHGHKKAHQIAVAMNGSCKFYVNNGVKKEEFILNSPDVGLYLEPKDWHYMTDFKDNCVVMVVASMEYDPEDYIYDEP